MRFLIISLGLALVVVLGSVIEVKASPRPEPLRNLARAVRSYIATDALHDHFLLTDNRTGRVPKALIGRYPYRTHPNSQ